ncbi:MAG: hypothetical protein ACD_75C01045G0004 [uncultured bacterium]|nr:MAG: hypothetical protein ACD_75C01045G0004 [uncultured bacterium]
MNAPGNKRFRHKIIMDDGYCEIWVFHLNERGAGLALNAWRHNDGPGPGRGEQVSPGGLGQKGDVGGTGTIQRGKALDDEVLVAVNLAIHHVGQGADGDFFYRHSCCR